MKHITVAASEKWFQGLFSVLRDNFTFSKSSDSVNFGPFSASYSVKFHLEDGTVDLRDGNKVTIRELDIKWDKLQAGVGFDIREICVGGWCIISTPWGCALRFPEICVFSANPDIGINLDLRGVVTSEVSVTASPVTKYKIDPASIPNKWQIFIDPVTVDVDVFDIADMVGDLLENAVKAAINDLIRFLPGFVKDLIWAMLGPVIDLIREILDLPDDISEWFSNLLGVSLGLINSIVTAVADYFAKQYPIHEFEDPFPILPAGVVTPVEIPIKDLAVQINTNEMILEANVGA